MVEEKGDIHISDYNYNLPEENIAAFPLPKRDESRLLVYKSGKIKDDHFFHLPNHLPHGCTLVANNTQVIQARILFQKATGGIVEVFCLEPANNKPIEQALAQTGFAEWNCLVGGASKWKPGQLLQKTLPDGTLTASYVQKGLGHFVIRFEWLPAERSFAEVLHQAGAMPLPPYIKRAAQKEDAARYQTIFAQHEGSVAAPTAALHFTPEVFEALTQKEIKPAYVTLHVGAGTFKPVKTETIGEHQMHAEHFQVSVQTLETLIAANDIVAVGTTSLRTLESLYWIGVKVLRNDIAEEQELALGQWEAYELEANNISYKDSLLALLRYLNQRNQTLLFCRTALLIVPGYRTRSAMALITNFHQPQSTLLLLVAAFIGADWQKVYAHALENGYRFLSYGDSSLLFRKDSLI